MYIPLTTSTTQAELCTPSPLYFLASGILLSSLIYGAFLAGRIWPQNHWQVAADSSSYASSGSGAFLVEKSGQHDDESGITPATPEPPLVSLAVIQHRRGNIAELPAAFGDSHFSGCSSYHPPSPSLFQLEGDPNPLPSEEEEYGDEEDGESGLLRVPNALADRFPMPVLDTSWWTWGQPWAPKKNLSNGQPHTIDLDSSMAQAPPFASEADVVNRESGQKTCSICDLHY